VVYVRNDLKAGNDRSRQMSGTLRRWRIILKKKRGTSPNATVALGQISPSRKARPSHAGD